MKNKCPYCGKTHCVREIVFINVESYGSNTFHLPCEHCGKMIFVSVRRLVSLTGVEKSSRSRDEGDY